MKGRRKREGIEEGQEREMRKLCYSLHIRQLTK